MGRADRAKANNSRQGAAKYDSAVVFNLSVDALYALSGGDFSEKVVKTVMAEAATRLIHARTVYDIHESLEPPPQATEQLEAQMNAEDEAEAQHLAQEQQEAEKILDEPPPELPPAPEPEKVDPDLYIRMQLVAQVTELKRLATKRVKRFEGIAVNPDDLDIVIAFLTALKPIVGEKPAAEAA